MRPAPFLPVRFSPLQPKSLQLKGNIMKTHRSYSLLVALAMLFAFAIPYMLSIPLAIARALRSDPLVLDRIG